MSKTSNQTIQKLQETGAFYIPADAFCSELHLAAFLGCPRRTVIDALFHPVDGEGIPFVSVGGRKVFAMDAGLEAVRKLARSQPRLRRKGGMQCRRKGPSNDAE